MSFSPENWHVDSRKTSSEGLLALIEEGSEDYEDIHEFVTSNFSGKPKEFYNAARYARKIGTELANRYLRFNDNTDFRNPQMLARLLRNLAFTSELCKTAFEVYTQDGLPLDIRDQRDALHFLAHSASQDDAYVRIVLSYQYHDLGLRIAKRCIDSRQKIIDYSKKFSQINSEVNANSFEVEVFNANLDIYKVSANTFYWTILSFLNNEVSDEVNQFSTKIEENRRLFTSLTHLVETSIPFVVEGFDMLVDIKSSKLRSLVGSRGTQRFIRESLTNGISSYLTALNLAAPLYYDSNPEQFEAIIKGGFVGGFLQLLQSYWVICNYNKDFANLIDTKRIDSDISIFLGLESEYEYEYGYENEYEAVTLRILKTLDTEVIDFLLNLNANLDRYRSIETKINYREVFRSFKEQFPILCTHVITQKQIRMARNRLRKK